MSKKNKNKSNERTQELILTRGLPRSGKTTWAKGWIARDPDNRIRVNRDDLRFALYGKYVLQFHEEKLITEVQHGAIRAALKSGKSVVVDDTNLNLKFLGALVILAREFSYKIDLRYQDFTTDVDECIRRDQKCKENGERAVGAEVITRMARKSMGGGKLPVLGAEFYDISPIIPTVYVEDESLPKAWIFDIDGTLAQMVDRGPFEWSRVGEDNPVPAIVELAQMVKEAGRELIIFSGRDGVCEPETRAWLKEHKVPYDQLHMRPEGNYEKDYIIKERLFNSFVKGKFYVRGVVDDRLDVVRLWYSMGLPLLRAGDPDANF
jgi:predicted kinase